MSNRFCVVLLVGATYAASAPRRHYAKIPAACRRSGLIFAFGFRSSIFAPAPKKLRAGMIFDVPLGVLKCIFVDNVSLVQKTFAPNVKIVFVFQVGIRHLPEPKRSLIHQCINDFLAGSSMLKALQLNGRSSCRKLQAQRDDFFRINSFSSDSLSAFALGILAASQGNLPLLGSSCSRQRSGDVFFGRLGSVSLEV